MEEDTITDWAEVERELAHEEANRRRNPYGREGSYRPTSRHTPSPHARQQKRAKAKQAKKQRQHERRVRK